MSSDVDSLSGGAVGSRQQVAEAVLAYDPNDPEQAAAVQAAVKAEADRAAEQLRQVTTQHNAALTKAREEADAAKAAAAKAAADLAAAQESGTATASQIAALTAKVEAADKAEAARAADALKSRLAALPEGVRAKAPTDPAALSTWLEIAEAMPAGIPGRTAAGGSPADEPTEADLAWAKQYGYDRAAPATIIAISKQYGPRKVAEPTPTPTA